MAKCITENASKDEDARHCFAIDFRKVPKGDSTEESHTCTIIH
jgi:hypothetical protein